MKFMCFFDLEMVGEGTPTETQKATTNDEDTNGFNGFIDTLIHKHRQVLAHTELLCDRAVA